MDFNNVVGICGLLKYCKWFNGIVFYILVDSVGDLFFLMY